MIGIKNILKPLLIPLAKTFNRNIVRFILPIMGKNRLKVFEPDLNMIIQK